MAGVDQSGASPAPKAEEIAAYSDAILEAMPNAHEAGLNPAAMIPGMALACVCLLWAGAREHVPTMYSTMKAFHSLVRSYHHQFAVNAQKAGKGFKR